MAVRLRRVVRLVHAPAEQPTPEWSEPLEHVVHVSQVDHLDQVAVEVTREEKPVPPWRLLGSAEALDAFSRQLLVPAMDVAHVHREMGEAHPIPGNRGRRELRLELENLERGAAGHSNPPDLAGGC